MAIMDFQRMIELGSVPREPPSCGIDSSQDLLNAAVAVEHVLSAAHERGSADAVMILSTVCALLREAARDRGKTEAQYRRSLAPR
jgi:hypothetical protein